MSCAFFSSFVVVMVVVVDVCLFVWSWFGVVVVVVCLFACLLACLFACLFLVGGFLLLFSLCSFCFFFPCGRTDHTVQSKQTNNNNNSKQTKKSKMTASVPKHDQNTQKDQKNAYFNWTVKICAIIQCQHPLQSINRHIIHQETMIGMKFDPNRFRLPD